MQFNTLQANAETGRPGRTAPLGLVLASLGIPALMASLDTSIANVALPTLAHAFGATFHQVQWVVLAYLISVTTWIVGAGRLADRLGRRRTLVAGIVVFTAASAACGDSTSLGMLVAARAAQGLGASVMMALSLAFVGDAVPAEATGRAMGLLGTMSAIGTALGPSLGGVLIAAAGWRAVFLVNVPIGVVSAALVLYALPADALPRPQHGARLPFADALLQIRALGAGLGANALVTAVVMSTMVVGPFYLAGALGLGAARVGVLMSAGPIVVALSGVPAGHAVDRLGARPAALIGLFGMAAGALLLSLLPRAFGIPAYVLPIGLLTASYALFQVANNTAVMAGVRADERGGVAGWLGLSRNLGLIAGAGLMGGVFAFASGASHISAARPEAVALGMRATFAFAVMLIGLALALTLLSVSTRSTQSTLHTPHGGSPS